MGNAAADGSSSEGAAALSLMQEALDKLDQAEFAPEAGAHLDLAICRLRDALEAAGMDGFESRAEDLVQGRKSRPSAP